MAPVPLGSWWVREVEQAKVESRDPQRLRHGRLLLECWAMARCFRRAMREAGR
jgi:hypothetical protein